MSGRFLHGLGSRAVTRGAHGRVDWSPYPGENTMKFRAYIVEDSPTIRQNLIETLQELAAVEPVGTAETEHEGKRWLAQNDGQWDIAIVDLFLREGSGLNILEACSSRKRAGQKMI